MQLTVMLVCILQLKVPTKMTIEALTVFHYLYGYQTMRLASQDEIKSTQTLGNSESFYISKVLSRKISVEESQKKVFSMWNHSHSAGY